MRASARETVSTPASSNALRISANLALRTISSGVSDRSGDGASSRISGDSEGDAASGVPGKSEGDASSGMLVNSEEDDSSWGGGDSDGWPLGVSAGLALT